MTTVGTSLAMFRNAAVCACLLASGFLSAQGPVARIGRINDSERATVGGTRPPAARAEADAGAMEDGKTIAGMTIVFNRSAAQQADLDSLLAAQQDVTSPLYHQWLTPDQFAARFGVADADLSAVSAWLGTHGLQVGAVARSRDRISFTGNAAQFASAFGTPLHYFNVGGVKHFAPAADVSVPTAIAGSVLSVENVTDFRAVSHMVQKPVAAFTSSQTGNHFLTPKDLATIYDVNAAYNAGYTGTGQSIAVIGQSAVVTADITNFQTAAGVPVRAPVYVLMPGTGTSTVYTGDESESDLDLEYSSAMAQGATIYFVYTGSSPNYGISDALNYAVTNLVAPIITLSYGYCEATLSASLYSSMNAVMQQAAAQGQTVINSTGDEGSTACYGAGSTAYYGTLAVSYPASSQYVTGIGGTEFAAASVASTNNTYFTAASGTDVIGSALSYIPEIAWNDDTSSGLSSGGGGASVFTPRPTWQAGVPGIPAGTFRLVPDVSLAASPSNPGYLYCSSDATVGVTGSCSHGFRDTSNVSLTVAGGTSFAAPSFAGMLAIILQKVNANGAGVINPTLYTLAANPTTYATAFHDITTGTNGCTGVTSCTTANEAAYAAGVGYDEATGLGSIDLYNLMTAWPSLSSLAGTKLTLSAATSSVAVNASDAVTVTVAPALTSSTVPAGTVTIKLDGNTVTTLTLVNGSATYTFSSTTSGNHIVAATYSGNTTYAASSNTLVITTTAIGGFTISAGAVAVTNGNTVTEPITITPNGGYTGSVGFTVSTPTSITNTCYVLGAANVTGTSPVQTTLTIYTSANNCTGYTPLKQNGGTVAALGHGSLPGGSAPVGISLAGLMAIGVLGRKSRRLRGLVVVAVLAVAGFGLSGCGDTTGSTTTLTPPSQNAATGAYTVTLVGSDAVTPSITATTTFVLTVQ